MGYAATTGFILYWNPDQLFVIHRYQNVWFDEYNSRLSIEDRCIPFIYSFVNITKVLFIIKSSSNLFHVYLILNPIHFAIQQLSHMKLSYLPLEKMGINFLDDEDSTIPYITDTIQNSSAVHQLPSKANINVWIIAINGEKSITSQGIPDELNCHQTPRVKSNIKINLCRRKIY